MRCESARSSEVFCREMSISLPAQNPSGSKLNVLAIPCGNIPSTTIGVVRPLSELGSEIRLRVRLPDQLLPSEIDWCDIAVFSRNTDPTSLAAFRLARSKGKATIYELDDSFFDVPGNVRALRKYRQPALLGRLREFLSHADRVHAYSARVHEGVCEIGGFAHRVPTYFDDALRISPDEVNLQERDDVIRVAFPTTRSDNPDIARFSEAVFADLLANIPTAELHLWRDPGGLRNHPRVRWHPPELDYRSFIDKLRTINPTVGLAILGDSHWEASKTNNKYREFAGLGIPGVYSDMPVYRECVINQVTGILSPNTVDQWTRSIRHLSTEPALRQKIRRDALDDVATNYTLEGSVSFWREALEGAAAHRHASPANALPTSAMCIRFPQPWGLRRRERYARRVVAAVPSATDQAEGSQVESVTLVPATSIRGRLMRPPTAPGCLVLDTTCADVDVAEIGRFQKDLPPGSVILVSDSRRAAAQSPGCGWLPDIRALPGGVTRISVRPDAVDGPESWGFAVILAATIPLDQGGCVLDWSEPTVMSPGSAAMKLARLELRLGRARLQVARGKRLASYPLPVLTSLLRQRVSERVARGR